jgi:hypothetical protein
MKINGDGTFIATGGSGTSKVQAMEDLDLSDPENDSLPPLLRVQVL